MSPAERPPRSDFAAAAATEVLKWGELQWLGAAGKAAAPRLGTDCLWVVALIVGFCAGRRRSTAVSGLCSVHTIAQPTPPAPGCRGFSLGSSSSGGASAGCQYEASGCLPLSCASPCCYFDSTGCLLAADTQVLHAVLLSATYDSWEIMLRAAEGEAALPCSCDAGGRAGKAPLGHRASADCTWLPLATAAATPAPPRCLRLSCPLEGWFGAYYV
jgi:hypothetical protein